MATRSIKRIDQPASAAAARALPSRFLGKVALVTGASNRGIGGAIAERLAKEGAMVVTASLHEPTRLLHKLSEAKVTCSWNQCDVTKPDQVIQTIDSVVEELGRLDVVINNAGYDVAGPFSRLTDAQWQHILEVNLSGVMNISRAALPQLEIWKGVIVNITSASGLGGTPGLAAYSAAKAGVDGLTRSLAVEYAPKSVRVVGVAPALVKTPMSTRYAAGMTTKVWDKLVDCHPLGIGATQDVASAVAFLASHEARWISGITLPLGWMPSYPLPFDAYVGGAE